MFFKAKLTHYFFRKTDYLVDIIALCARDHQLQDKVITSDKDCTYHITFFKIKEEISGVLDLKGLV